MKKTQIGWWVFILFAFAKANSQILINEIDADTPSTNDKQFVELKTENPYQLLDGYVLVFFNGRAPSDMSYAAIDLDGLRSDNNGLIVLGSSKTVPAVDRRIIEAQIQLGADAVAVYLGDDIDFPEGTIPTDVNLIDALVYGTDDADDIALMQSLRVSIQHNENANNRKTEESIQRNLDGSFSIKAPTPHYDNNLEAPPYIGLDFNITPTGNLKEGDSFTISFQLDRESTVDISTTFSLSNSGFNQEDYTGTTQLLIPAGTTTQMLDFTIINDSFDEGDEFLEVNLSNNLPDNFKRLSDNQRVLVIDDDFTMASYGNPDQPTYQLVASTAPVDYYDRLIDKSAKALEDEITAIIAERGVVRHHNYADMIEILKKADQSALNSNKVWLLYTEEERRSVNFQGQQRRESQWNREHIYSRSRGGFDSVQDLDDVADGITIWEETSVDSLRHGNSDAHHLRATDPGENSSRSAQNYPEYSGPTGTRGSWKGDVARSIFYMSQRYKYSTGEMLQIVNGNPSTRMGLIGDLNTLLEWHRQDPPDDFEMHRNNVIYQWQRNRNPFIDLPELAEYIWGNRQNQAFTLSNARAAISRVSIFPNPTTGSFKIVSINQPTILSIIDMTGRTITKQLIATDKRLEMDLESGIYLIHLSNNEGQQSIKLIKN